ncbi:hypothetical protein [Desulfonatronovibrio magnus]|uniref:hypothetical protein n=1 Tax=Desulfonatronovibrio magnus TaxID=698827 RepID=UPI0005EBF0FD|nr:hypothetical protein [Desulfonatronovibrio magnus]
MQKIPLDKAKPGMVLAKPILRDNGMVLVAEGTEITDTLITRLENMDIPSVVVQGHPVEMEGVDPPKTYKQRVQEMDHLFRNFNDDQWMTRMKLFLKAYFKKKMVMEAAQTSTSQQPETDSPSKEQK